MANKEQMGEEFDALMSDGDKTINIGTILVDPESLIIRSILPGILVSFTCHMRGGRWTKRRNYVERTGENGEKIETWDAERCVMSPEEVKDADKLRAKVHRAIKKLGVLTQVGLIVPAHRKAELAQTIAACDQRVQGWNSKATTLNLIYRCGLYNVEGSSAGTIAAVTEQLSGILQQVNDAIRNDDEKILSFASKAQLGEFRTAAEVLAAPVDQKIAVIAKVRADLTRKAIAEAKSFSTLLPEDASLAVTDMVSVIRNNASDWLKASKVSNQAYQTALNTVDLDGIGAMQAALVKAAAMADRKASEETAIASGGIVAKLDFADEPEVNLGSEVKIEMDLFKNMQGGPDNGEPDAGTMAV
jgi:hypothetical protein